MKKHPVNFKSACIASMALCSLCSCLIIGETPYNIPVSTQKQNLYYIGSAPNTPMLSKKNDFNISMMAAASKVISGGEFQASYMPAKHVGIMGSYSFTGDRSKYSRMEMGAGYVTNLNKKIQFESYAGFGNGKIRNSHTTGNSVIKLTHFFLQPTLVLNNVKRNIQLGIVSKFSGVKFNVTDTSFNTDRERYSTSQVLSLYETPFHVMWEPSLIFRFGWKNFQFHTGFTTTADLTNKLLNKTNGRISMGISLRFNHREDAKSE